jgi:addiction module RelE/StbE family toxin
VAKIRYSPASLQDLVQIGDYISEELQNPSAAFRLVANIQNAIDKLVDFPQMGTPLSSRYEDVGDYRYLVCGNYLAFYREDAENVWIDRILYGKRDYVNILFGGVLEQETD